MVPISSRRPWSAGTRPLMLAPMQGLTNHALRNLLIDWVAPDVVFTEFIRVSAVSRKRVARSDLHDISLSRPGTPLVAQLVGHGQQALVDAAIQAQEAGAEHLNLNLGCPYGRMTSSATGGKLLQHPQLLQDILPALRKATKGSFSVKTRAGYSDPEDIFSLLSLFEDSGVDFLIVHPRTVEQKYHLRADHSVTIRVSQQTKLPVIANGDIFSVCTATHLQHQKNIAGLMLGRGAMSDPLLFQRLRGLAKSDPKPEELETLQKDFLLRLIPAYTELFCGEAQVLTKLKGVLTGMGPKAMGAGLTRIKRARSLNEFRDHLLNTARELG